MGSFSLYLFGEIAQNRGSHVLAVLTNKFCYGTRGASYPPRGGSLITQCLRGRYLEYTMIVYK